MTLRVLAFAVPAFALSWWLAAYLIGRDPGRPALRWASAGLTAYGVGVAAWTVDPGGRTAQILICLPALAWAGSVVALLPLPPAERRPIDVGALVLGVSFQLLVIALPGAGKLVGLTPLGGALFLLWRGRAQVVPRRLPLALTLMALLYAAAMTALLVPLDAGGPVPALAASGVDLLVFGYLIAVAHAVTGGERLRPDLRRSLAAAAAVLVLVGLPATLTLYVVPADAVVTCLQFVPVGVAAAAAGLTGRMSRLLDRVALAGDVRLRHDRAALFLNADALLRRRERRTLAELGEPEFLRLTRRALADFNDLNRLSRSPLTGLPVVARRIAGRGDDQPRARARELRAVLRESVSALRPTGPFGTTEDWRYYNTLQFCGVLGLDPYARRQRLDGLSREARMAVDWFRRNVPEDTMRQWHREAAMIVAGHLWSEALSDDRSRHAASNPS
ncbi:hypothetical protein ACWT_7303 [Actinoplanes sp. SE50]|uniref:hypothetical protein n=1 Tax=unclassified Actinoplanes TaxID=2626549 RepID=UPI00023EDF93|nr:MULTISPECIES: hypothetical protein [unclassified Actinoplanes]AEV88313.1 hypothetical protein ACPL_7433 [Actinoplanes sp. SE50/110]ATO86718.1 hypothetical protein ACWT_7303 [Actinoplanes sp. SE50]SLM04136.1 hypothetical protein ACSP50_7438 [Actinoplanes sp. SE50/110]